MLMPNTQKLTALDASFLHLETPNTPMHIGGVAICEPSPLGTGRDLYEGLIRAIEPRLDMMPRYRQKLAFVPLKLDLPVWVDDEQFDIRKHVLRSHLPSPGGDEELAAFIGRLFSQLLDRRRPLWELHIVEGLPEGRWALIAKTHHAMVDGKSNLELVSILMDTEPNVTRAAGKSTWTGEAGPSPLGLLLNSLREKAETPGRLIKTAQSAMENPGRLATALRDTASGLAVMARTAGASTTAINGPIGPSRLYMTSRFSLADFKAVKDAFGGTINDVVLAVVTGGLRHFLFERGYEPEMELLKALCPVSIRDSSERSALGNRLAMLLVELPVGEEDVLRRYDIVRGRVDHLKARKQAVGADFLLNLGGFAPPTLHAMVARSSLKQLGFNLVVTNVPGPQFPLYLQGARLVEAFPIAFLYEDQRVSIAIFSYCGYLNFGYIADQETMADLPVLVEGIEMALAELALLARSESERSNKGAARRTRTGTGSQRGSTDPPLRGRSAGARKEPVKVSAR